MKRELRGLRVLITGASSGIGRSLAEQAARAGARVIVTARSAPALEELAGRLTTGGAEAAAIPADLTSEVDRRSLIAAAAERFDGLDVLINNAGVASAGHFADGTEAVLRRVMEVNFFAPAELIRLAIPALTRGRKPAVVNIASMCGRRGMPAWTEYSSSKFALCGLTEALRAELSRFDIDALLVVPGMTRSGLADHMLRNEARMKFRFDRGMAVEHVARHVLNALRCSRTETVLGADARWMLRFNRFFPRWLDRLIARRVRRLYAANMDSEN
ncbi:MAG TPA: SDR family NAD(P)-dependent oxidoreductase [Gemmataceae bacterium]|nr:SDR family NAD(P)-dependent oxidoreductase [Gemmataceae bacterium]